MKPNIALIMFRLIYQKFLDKIVVDGRLLTFHLTNEKTVYRIIKSPDDVLTLFQDVVDNLSEAYPDFNSPELTEDVSKYELVSKLANRILLRSEWLALQHLKQMYKETYNDVLGDEINKIFEKFKDVEGNENQQE